MNSETSSSAQRGIRANQVDIPYGNLFRGWSMFSIGMASVLCVLYLVLFGFRALVELDVQLQTPQASFVKIYWADEGKVFTEKNMSQVLIRPGKQNYSVYLTHLGNVDRLRIDPLEYAGEIDFKQIRLSQRGYETIELKTEQQFESFKPLKGIKLKQLGNETRTGIGLETSGSDSQIEWDLNPVNISFFPLRHVVSLALILLLVGLMRKPAQLLFRNHVFVPVCLVAILILVTTMAVITTLRVHPDEVVHLQAVKYYSDHLLPPAIDSLEASDSFSGYGYSRLANFESYYPLAGYFSFLLKPFHLDEVIEARMFGLLMLMLLVLFAVCKPAFRIFALPLLISAQTWYLFSYVNSDGFALFVATLASYQAACEKSMMNRFLVQKQIRGYWLSLLILGGLFGILLLSKTNFYFFLIFLGAYFLWRMSIGDFKDQKLFWSRVFVICVVGLGMYGGRVALDYAVNGPEPSALKAEMIELHAEPIYKPSTPLERKHIYLYLKDRNFSLDRILNKEKWPGKTFLNAFGSYGFTQFFPSMAYFETVKNTGLFLLAFMLAGILINGPPRTHGLFLLVLMCATALVLMLLWRSWTISFQAQGRYLAPILPMMGILYYHIRSSVNQKILVSLTIAMFFLGVYSFLFVGLYEIPKVNLLG